MLRKEAKTLEQAQGLGGRLASTKLYIICLVSNTTIILYRKEILSERDGNKSFGSFITSHQLMFLGTLESQ